MATRVELEIRNQTAWITFVEESERRPCTLDHDVLSGLDNALDAAEKDTSVTSVMIRAASEKYFVVGANINALQNLTPAGMDPWCRHGHNVFNRMEDFPVPVVAITAGAVMGGGLELAMACDFIIAGDAARFAQPEANLGFVPGWGGTYRLARLVGIQRAKYLYCTGRVLTAAEALDWGLIAEVVPAANLQTRAEELARLIAQNSSIGIRATKELVNDYNNDHRKKSMTCEAWLSYSCLDDPDSRARMEAFFASRRKK